MAIGLRREREKRNTGIGRRDGMGLILYLGISCSRAGFPNLETSPSSDQGLAYGLEFVAAVHELEKLLEMSGMSLSLMKESNKKRDK